MYDLIPIILIIASLAVVIYITVRKFPALASLDVANIPAEKEARFKERIISSRLKRNYFKWSNRLAKIFGPIGHGFGNFFRWLYAKLVDLKESYKTERVVPAEDLERRLIILLEEAENLRRQDDLVNMEKKLIEAISLDGKNLRAFKLLAQLYFERKDLDEARQTYEHILKLSEGDEEAFAGLAQVASSQGDLGLARDEYLKSLTFDSQRGHTFYNLALIYEGMKNPDEALTSIKKALEIEPLNPRYLDSALRISIMIKDKDFAREAFQSLEHANPENQKLAEFREQIGLL